MSYDYLEAKRRNDFLEEVNKNLVIECEALKSGQGLPGCPRIIDQILTPVRGALTGEMY